MFQYEQLGSILSHSCLPQEGQEIYRFTLGPSEETWSHLLSLMADKHALKDSKTSFKEALHINSEWQ